MFHTETFDFASYLHLHTGVESWEIEQLTGGAANYTVRVRRLASLPVDKHDTEGSLAGYYRKIFSVHESVVFKQAPAFLAKAPQIPFSPYRQIIEANALQILHQSPDEHPFGLKSILEQNPFIKIPELLLQDKTHDVIVQSDLGVHPTLYDVLSSPDTTAELSSKLGKIIGQFLANLHNAFYISPRGSSDLIAAFKNDDAERVMRSVINLALSLMKDAEVSDYDILGKLALNHWNSRTKTAFSQGDLWFGTLLIEEPSHQTLTTAKNIITVGICDWEFAGPNHAAADIAQLGTTILALSVQRLNRSRHILMAFSSALYQTYFSATPPPLNMAEYQRSLVIMHGWEMINAAGWKSRQHIWCNCSGDGIRCYHIKNMVEEGAKLLRAAVSDNGMDFQALKEIAWSQFFPIPQ